MLQLNSSIDNLSQYDSTCLKAQTIASTPGFNFILFLEIILGVCASIPNFFLICTIWRVTVFHKNLRLLLLHLSLTLLWYSFGYVIKSITLLPVLLRGDPCQLITKIYECKLKEVGLGIPAQASVYAGMAVSLERLYSTIYYKRYDQGSDRIPYLGICLIVFAYIIPVANTLNSLLALSKANDLLPICENTLSSTKASASTVIAINLTAMFLCVCVVGLIWYMNDTRLRTMVMNRAAKHTLAARFQVEQNVQVNRIIIPSTILQMLCYIPNYVFLFLILVGLKLDDETKITLIHCNYLWKECYSIMHPLVCFARHEKIRKELYKAMPILKRLKSKVTSSGDGKIFGVDNGASQNRQQSTTKVMNTHFQMLSDAWNVKK